MNTVNSPSYFSQTDFSSEGFACRLANLVDLSQKKNGHRPILFLCIGSDRVPGDCLGPLVGYKLERLCDTMQHTFVVCGSLAHPVHAVNLRQKLHYVKHLGNFLTIAIDASIGAKENLGMLCLSNSALYPGEGVAKSLPPVGEISITGVTSCEDNPIPFHRQSVPLSFMMNLADEIYQGLFTFLTAYFQTVPYTESMLLQATDLHSPDRRNQTYLNAACTADPFQRQAHILP